jgi:hypothetical protein
MKKVFLILLAAQVVCLGGFILAIYKADNAMDKSGIGNLQSWQHWNSIASGMFWCGLATWTICILIGVMSKQLNSLTAQLAIGVPPLIFLVSYIGYFFI